MSVKDAGFIDVKDKAAYEIAKAYLKLFAKNPASKREINAHTKQKYK